MIRRAVPVVYLNVHPDTASLPAAAAGRRPHRLRGALIGLLTAGLALGVAELVAAFVGEDASPIVAVGGSAIDATPEWLKSFAIRTFGSSDKLVLAIGIIVVLTLLSVVLGIAATRRRAWGIGGLAVFGAAGALAAVTRPTGTIADALPALLGSAAGMLALSALLQAGEPAASGAPDEATEATEAEDVGRRRFLLTSLAVGGIAFASAGAGRALIRNRFDVEQSRSSVSLPAARDGAPRPPPGADLDVAGLEPFITPNEEFYRVDTALIVPKVEAADWRLRVHGMVDREIQLDYEQLLRRPLIERDITLTCVSNEVGGPYVGTARWLGAPLAALLDEAGVAPGSTQLVSRSIDGMTIGTPVDVVMDGRDAMLAVAMNGEPLPVEHGFPVRQVVPGLYGYVSATKWLVDLELSTFDAFDPYWVRRGWVEEAPVKTMSRIDTPRPFANPRAGTVPVAGVAWAQQLGIDRVEVSVDGGDWADAELAEEDTIDTWRQWVYPWEATPGRHTLAVRATDRDGLTQPEERTKPFPSGATGWHTIVVEVP